MNYICLIQITFEWLLYIRYIIFSRWPLQILISGFWFFHDYLLSSLFIKGVWLPLICFSFKGVWWFKISTKISESFSYGSCTLLSKSWRNFFWPKCFRSLYFIILAGSFLKEALRILQMSLWQTLKPVSKFWDFIKLLRLLVNIKSRRVLYC